MFENSFKYAKEIDEVYERIRSSETAEQKKDHLVKIFSSGIDYLANPFMIVKNAIVAERYLWMFDKYY